MTDLPRQPAPGEVLITRIFDASPALVFSTWTSAEQLYRWYAPDGCMLTHCAIDFRPGGALHLCIRGPDGHECWCAGTYRDIVTGQRIVYTLANVDAMGRLIDPTSIGMDPAWPVETLITVTFSEERDGRTRMTLHQTVDETVAKRTGAHPSWLSMFDRLALLLSPI